MKNTGKLLFKFLKDYNVWPLKSTHVREREQKLKEYIQSLFDYEMAYINTNHEDFIGFTQAAANTTTEIKRNPNQNPANTVIRKGWLSLTSLGVMRGNFHWNQHESENFLYRETPSRTLTE